MIGLLASLNAMAAGSPDDVVAKMGTNEIKRSELNQMLSAAQASSPEARPSVQAIDQALRAELIRRALVEEAKRVAWDKRPEVQQQIERAREQVIVTSFMNQQARPASAYPSEQEIQTTYDANKALFVQTPQVRLIQIYLPASEADSSTKAEALWRQANEKGADFAELARKQSKHAESAAKGGDMGWLQEDQLVPEIRAAIQKLAIGQIAKPIKAADGWHVLKMAERKAALQKSLAEVRENLVQSMRLKKAQENEQQYLNQLLLKMPITVNEIALSSLAATSK
ncbi:MAG: peptidylprolyl isomerase [Hydrogenophilales bacterium]|nr:peptidylprolyl isomerase [Hydrogenophilales bacterium]